MHAEFWFKKPEGRRPMPTKCAGSSLTLIKMNRLGAGLV
jgi:hypothetical protein